MRYWLWLLACIAAQYVNAASVTDDMGHVVSLAQPAQRVVSLAPDATEILFIIGAGSHVVGVVTGSDYPAAALKIPRVGSYSGIDIERVLSLHPDLIVAWQGTFARPLLALQKMGIPVYWIKPRQIQDVSKTMRQIGVLLNIEMSANAVAAQFDAQLTQLKHTYESSVPVSVFYQIGSYSLMTINQDSWINQVIELCGGHNVFSQLHSIAPEVSWESAVTANPEVIISDTKNADWRARWLKWPNVRAVKNNAMYEVNPDWIERAGPRLLQGAAELCRCLQDARLRGTA